MSADMWIVAIIAYTLGLLSIAWFDIRKQLNEFHKRYVQSRRPSNLDYAVEIQKARVASEAILKHHTETPPPRYSCYECGKDLGPISYRPIGPMFYGSVTCFECTKAGNERYWRIQKRRRHLRRNRPKKAIGNDEWPQAIITTKR